MMDRKKIYNLAILMVPWLTVPFMRRQSFFRFLPVASFIGLFLSTFSSIANNKKWWVTKTPLFPGIPIDFPFIFGPYFVGTLWVFKLAYGNFPKFLITNIALDLINAFPLFYLLERVQLVKFKKMRYTTWFFISVFMAVFLYVFQYTVEKSINKQRMNDKYNG